jgi:hypothetical protein
MQYFQVVGLGLIACGSWMHASADVHAYITIFVRSTNDRSLLAAAALIVTSGVILFLASVLGIFAVVKEHRKLLMLVSEIDVFLKIQQNTPIITYMNYTLRDL